MIIRTLSGQEIDYAFTLAMQVTVESLIDEGLLDPDKAIEFVDTHICVNTSTEPIYKKIQKWLGMTATDTTSRPVIFKVAHKKGSVG